MRICLFNFCSWFFYGYQNKRNQHSNLFHNRQFCDFRVSVPFVVYFQKLVIYLISCATFVTDTLCFKFVLSLIDPILGLDSMPLI